MSNYYPTRNPFSRRHLLAAALLVAATQLPSQSYGQAFLFEDVAAGDHPGSVSVTEGSQTLQVTPEGAPNGSVTVLLRDAPLLHGVVANAGSTTVSGQFVPLRFTFSQPVTAITFGFEDATGGSGGDIDGSVTIRGFDSSANLLGTMLYNNPTYDGGTYQTLSGSFAGASYFIASSDSPPDNLNSLVYEIVDSTPGTPTVPDSGSTGLLLAFATAGLICTRRQLASV